MSFIYPRTISFYRLPASTGEGVIAYQGSQRSRATLITGPVKCSIQHAQSVKPPAAGLPADVVSGSAWNVFVPRQLISLGTLKDNDLCKDDLNIWYLIYFPYWNSLGYKLTCWKLKN